METEQNEITEYIGTIKKEYYQAYFGVDSDYYMPIMTDFENGKKFIFNGWAFWGGMLWQIYRRSYKQLLLFFLIGMFVTLIQTLAVSYYDLSQTINSIINLFVTIILGLIVRFSGNYFLMRKAQKRTQQILSKNEDEDTILLKLEKAGSGNSIGVIVCIVSFIAFFGMVALYNFQRGPGL